MSKVNKEVLPVTQQSQNFKGVYHVNVDKTVQAIAKELGQNDQVDFLSKQSEISRAGMVMKRVQEQTKARIISMKTENRVQKKQDRQFRVLYFRATFSK